MLTLLWNPQCFPEAWVGRGGKASSLVKIPKVRAGGMRHLYWFWEVSSMLGHRRDHSPAFLLARILDTLIQGEAIKGTRGYSWFHTGWGGQRAALSQHYFLSPSSYWNGDHKPKGRLGNWSWQNLERKSKGQSTWRMAKVHPWAGESRGPGASVTTPGTKETIVPDRWGHRHVAPSPKVRPFLKQRLGKRERLLSDGCLPRTTVQNSVLGRDVFLYWIPAGIICGLSKPVESSCPSCVAWIACIFLPASSLRLALGQHLTFTTGEQNHPTSFLSGDNTHWGAFVKSKATRGRMLWFLEAAFPVLSQWKLLWTACLKGVSGRA